MLQAVYFFQIINILGEHVKKAYSKQMLAEFDHSVLGGVSKMLKYTIATHGGADAPYFWVDLREESLLETYEEAQALADKINSEKGDGTDTGIYFVEEIDL